MHVGLNPLLAGRPLSAPESQELFAAVVRGDLSDIEITALLVALKLKGETPEEIAGAVQALRESAVAFPRPAYPFADIVGTGGDGANSINISTAASLLAAEAGVPVAKHGNRSISSRCGAADLLERYGVRLDMHPAVARRCLDETGITFLFAPHYHQGVRHVMPVRKHLAIRTVFNVLGPLINPARPPIMLVGVYEPTLCLLVANTLALLGCERALVVHGLGLDEIALHGETVAVALTDGQVTPRRFTPADFGVAELPISKIAGGTPEENAEALRATLGGQGEEAHAAAIAVNAAALLELAGVARSPAEGYDCARALLASGRVLQRLERFAALSRSA